MSIRVGLFGFGKTGSLVAKEIIGDPDLELCWVCRKSISENLKFASHSLGFDNSFAPFITRDDFNAGFIEKNPIDIAIDFSSAETVFKYDLLAKNKIKIVSAISKYNQNQTEEIFRISKKTAVLASPNITLGINWLIMASKILQKIIPHADVEIVEEHFRQKPEVSGTALKLAQHLHLDANSRVNSVRVGGIVGKHEVIFGLPYQTIRLTHESISRSAFGTGAIVAAKWLLDKEVGIFEMENIFSEKFKLYSDALA